jgi:Protein of unknown function (DUF4057)
VVKTERKINEQKFQELTGNDIFKEAVQAKSYPERMLSKAKRREMRDPARPWNLPGGTIMVDPASPHRAALPLFRWKPWGYFCFCIVLAKARGMAPMFLFLKE